MQNPGPITCTNIYIYMYVHTYANAYVHPYICMHTPTSCRSLGAETGGLAALVRGRQETVAAPRQADVVGLTGLEWSGGYAPDSLWHREIDNIRVHTYV